MVPINPVGAPPCKPTLWFHMFHRAGFVRLLVVVEYQPSWDLATFPADHRGRRAAVQFQFSHRGPPYNRAFASIANARSSTRMLVIIFGFSRSYKIRYDSS